MVWVVERVVVLRCGRVVGRRSLLCLHCCCCGEVLRCWVMRPEVEVISATRDDVWAGRGGWMRIKLWRHGKAVGANVGYRAGLLRVRYGSDGLGGSACT